MQLLPIGRTGAVHGLKGELKLAIEDAYFELLQDIELKTIFVEIKGQKLPYFIEQIRGEGMIILKLEDINDRNAASLLTHKNLYAKPADLGLEDDEEMVEELLKYATLQGYTMIDEHLGVLGEILAIEAYPHQEMAVIQRQDREVLVPLNRAFIQRRDKKLKQIFVDLPEGLLDL